jgi:hypothetical protein
VSVALCRYPELHAQRSVGEEIAAIVVDRPLAASFCRSHDDDDRHGDDFIDVHDIDLPTFAISAQPLSTHVFLSRGDTGFAGTGSCDVEQAAGCWSPPTAGRRTNYRTARNTPAMSRKTVFTLTDPLVGKPNLEAVPRESVKLRQDPLRARVSEWIRARAARRTTRCRRLRRRPSLPESALANGMRVTPLPTAGGSTSS